MAKDTRQNLIETAVDLIWQSSYGAVSVDGICQTAGVNKGSFYHFFPSKAALTVAAMEEHFAQFRPELDAAFSPALPPLKRFENLADMILLHQDLAFEKYGHVCGCPFASLGCEMAGQEEGIRAKTDEIFTTHAHYCEAALRDAVSQGHLPPNTDCVAVASELCAYTMGQLTMARIQNNLDGLRRDLRAGMLRVIGAKQEELA